MLGARSEALRTEGVNPMRTGFQSELETLKVEILRMGARVSDALALAVAALNQGDQQKAAQVIQGDTDIDLREVEIERQCLRLLALQQPMASDLRMISSALKVITDLERMADHATNVAKATIRLAGQPLIKPLVDIARMAQLVQEMLRKGLRAYTERDAAAAREYVALDDEIDHLYNAIFRELLLMMIHDQSVIEQATQLLFVAQNLERIGDHATNLAEWTIYMVTGDRPALNT